MGLENGTCPGRAGVVWGDGGRDDPRQRSCSTSLVEERALGRIGRADAGERQRAAASAFAEEGARVAVGGDIAALAQPQAQVVVPDPLPWIAGQEVGRAAWRGR